MWKASRARKTETKIMNRVSLEGVFVFVISFHCLFVAHFYRRRRTAGDRAQALDKFNLLLKRFFFTFQTFYVAWISNGIIESRLLETFLFSYFIHPTQLPASNVRALLSFSFNFLRFTSFSNSHSIVNENLLLPLFD